MAPLIVSRLAVTGGPDTGKEVISDKERLRVGAHSSNDLMLVEDRTASRHHFEIQYGTRVAPSRLIASGRSDRRWG